MFEVNPTVFVPPANLDAPIWRYMDFTQFVFMLEKQCLHFTPPDRFSDPFEGTLPKRVRERLRANKRSASTNRASGNVLSGLFSFIEYEEARRVFCVNCWHASQHESAAMWKMYLKSEEGIAIKSSYSRLKQAFDKTGSTHVSAGMVKYIDFDNDDIEGDHLYIGIMHKRRSFEYERELRVVAYDDSTTMERYTLDTIRDHPFPNGRDVPVDLNALVDAVYVSPVRQPWFKSLIESVMKRYKCKAPVLQSSLVAVPEW